MKEITKTKTHLVIKIPLKVPVRNCYMDDDADLGMKDNILGVIEGDEMGFANWIDMSYAGKEDQISSSFYNFYGTVEEFKKECKELGIYCHEYIKCEECEKVLYGSFTWGKKGETCFECAK